ncbi:MAG: TlpA family protein disulfide reductase [Oscillospiraceae bacterium]|jgi:thiol-disulfide isomerase/thioredoxin|nr:TlpA family protein disulfide reductase [Oscillospiraceae bacterium]
MYSSRTGKTLALTALCALLALTLAACGAPAVPSQNGSDAPEESFAPGVIAVGAPAPDFTADLLDGTSFQLSEQKDKAVLINFWATWCGPCVGELPAFTRLIETYGDKIALLAVNCGENEKTVTDFLERNGYTFPVALDLEGEISSLYPSDGIPYTLIIAPDGTISSIQLGASGADEMFDHYSAELDKALS